MRGSRKTYPDVSRSTFAFATISRSPPATRTASARNASPKARIRYEADAARNQYALVVMVGDTATTRRPICFVSNSDLAVVRSLTGLQVTKPC